LQPQFSGHQFKTLSKTECNFFEKLRVSVEEGTYEDIMKCFFCYVEGVFNNNELFTLVSPLFPSEELFN
jgi:histone deacetylase complex regulatory component SIN3